MPADTFAGALLASELENPDIAIVAHLFKNPIALDAAQVALADLTESDFVGYEPKTLEGAAIDVFEQANYAEAFFPEQEWEAGEDIVPQIVYGCYVTITLAGVGTVLNNVQIFETPIVLDTEGQKIARKFNVMSTSEALA